MGHAVCVWGSPGLLKQSCVVSIVEGERVSKTFAAQLHTSHKFRAFATLIKAFATLVRANATLVRAFAALVMVV